jgi:hypothetical protein
MNLMSARTKISKIVGFVQTATGIAAMIFAFVSFYNILDTQTIIGATPESIGLYLWIFIIFGLLSITSGLFLFYEG